jgi:A/G-specific adenine glycosylase
MSFVPQLLEWYEHSARELPWRPAISPYHTWISEIMLQQTQVETVMPYFARWMARFPDIESLAAADEQDVLGVWEGLGYYRRARNLHRAAQQVMVDHNGQLPRTRVALGTLPGIGPYTAAAIASIAFGEDVAAVDGNIRRVIARLFDVSVPARSTQGEKQIQALAQAHLPRGRAGDYNQALMDLGALICTPTSADCGSCPIARDCLARQLGLQEERPVRMPKKKIPHLTVTAGVIRQDGRVLLAQRPPKGLLGGLWEFPGGTLEEDDPDLRACLQREIREELGVALQVDAPFGQYDHAYTHFRITLHAFLCRLATGEEPQPLDGQVLAWAALAELPDYPMGKVDRQIALRLIKERGDGSLPG